MALQISLTGERTNKVYEVDDTRFFYREALGREVQILRGSFIKMRNGKSKFDADSFTGAVLSKYLVGWENLQDVGGIDIPYAEEVKPKVLELLPVDLLDALFSAIMGTLRVEEPEDEDNRP